MGDPIEFVPSTGAVKLTFKDKTYELPAPDLGQLREISTLFAGLEADEQAANDAYEKAVAAAEKSPKKPAPPPIDHLDRIGQRIDVMRKVASVLGQELPPAEQCPPWLGQGNVPALLDSHWMLHPFLALGLSASQGPKMQDEQTA